MAPSLPAVTQPVIPDTGDDLISQWLGGSANQAGFLRTSLDLTTRDGLAIATRMSGESQHDNSKIDGKEFTVVDYAIKAVHDVDPESGEIKIYPRITIACQDGTHLVFCGRVMLESVLLLAAGIKPDEWHSGLKVKVSSFKNKFKTLSHRLELVP